ncbi:unnamed protein product [Prunus armeniaca]
MDGGKTTAAATPPERGSKWGLGRLGLGFLGGFVGRMLGWAWWGKAKQIVSVYFSFGARSTFNILGPNKRHRFACVLKKINKAEREGVAAQLPWDISSTLGGYMKAT